MGAASPDLPASYRPSQSSTNVRQVSCVCQLQTRAVSGVAARRCLCRLAERRRQALRRRLAVRAMRAAGLPIDALRSAARSMIRS